MSSEPNSSQRSPLNFAICTCFIGAKSLGVVFSLMPGRTMGSTKSLRFAACFIKFSRVKVSPHWVRTWVTV